MHPDFELAARVKKLRREMNTLLALVAEREIKLNIEVDFYTGKSGVLQVSLKTEAYRRLVSSSDECAEEQQVSSEWQGDGFILPLGNDKDIQKSIIRSLNLILQYAGIDGEHHKTWVIDQVVRVLAGEDYRRFVAEFEYGEDGPQTYEWSEGIAP